MSKIPLNKIKPEKQYQCTLIRPTEVAGKMRSPISTYYFSGEIVADIYEDLKEVALLQP